jgi:hypothetical protein
VKFRAVIAPDAATALSLVNGATGDFIFETATTSSTTHAWLTGASAGANAWTTQIVIPAEYATAWTTATDTLDDLAGDSASVGQCLVSVTVFGSTANAASLPRLSGLYLAEWIGA